MKNFSIFFKITLDERKKTMYNTSEEVFQFLSFHEEDADTDCRPLVNVFFVLSPLTKSHESAIL